MGSEWMVMETNDSFVFRRNTINKTIKYILINSNAMVKNILITMRAFSQHCDVNSVLESCDSLDFPKRLKREARNTEQVQKHRCQFCLVLLIARGSLL